MEKPEEMFEFLRLVVYYDETTEPAYSRIQIKSGKPVIKYPISNHKPLSLYDSIPWRIEFFASDQLYYDMVFKINYSELTDVLKKKSHEFPLTERKNGLMDNRWNFDVVYHF